MDREQIIEKVKQQDGNYVKFAVADIDGVLRGKAVSKKKFLKSLDTGAGFCNVVFGWDSGDRVYENSDVTGWHTGYPDSTASVDIQTFRKIPWDDGTPFFLADFHQSEELSPVCPRTLLKRVRNQCLELGYLPRFASEYEWFNFKETPDTLQEKSFRDPQPMTPGMFGYSHLRASQKSDYFSDLINLLRSFGVSIEGMHTETGDGVYEGSIEYTDILEAADQSILFKTGVKEIASIHGLTASFMAKWTNRLPGCSGHLHQSLWDPEGKTNLFFDGEAASHISDLMRRYIAGQIYCLPHILPMYAPTVNSYKRFVAGSWAATTVSWGYDNRTTALRVLNSNQDSTRLETRVPGADINPYLAMAAGLASGIYGIRNEMELDMEPTSGNEYNREDAEHLPRDLHSAVERMRESGLAAELFGEAFTDHFLRTRDWEWQQFLTEVTDWELKRYFEII